MLMFLQQYKEQIFNIVESIQFLLLFTIMVGKRDFIHTNKFGVLGFILSFTLCGYLIDTYIPKGYNTLFYSLFLFVLFSLLIKEKIYYTTSALVFTFAVIILTEVITATFFSIFIIKKDVESLVKDFGSFTVVAVFLSLIRFSIIYFLYKSRFKIGNIFFFRLKSLLPAIIIQLVILTVFVHFTYLKIYENTPVIYELFCFIITLSSVFLSFFLIKSKERQIKLQYELKYKEKLAIDRERNRISRELHDTLGHTLTLLISLIKSSKINMRRNPEESEEKLLQAADIASEGLSQIRTAISGWLPEKISPRRIVTELQKLIEFSKDIGIDIEYCVYGEESEEDRDYSDVLYNICREAITNSLRHGKANKITVILKFFQGKIELFITDDGIGCKKIKKGFGLTGMEENVNKINGSLSYGASGGKGFNIHVEIPKRKIFH